MCQTVKNKNVANISRHLGSERRDFFRSPLHFTGSFSCPHSRGISGRGQAPTNSLLRYHAKLTGGPWDAVQNAMMGPRMSKQNRENGFFSCAHQGSTPHAAPNPGRSEQAYPNKERFGCGMRFCCWALQNFFTRGRLVGVSHAHPKSNLVVANRRSTKVGLCKTASAKHTPTFL